MFSLLLAAASPSLAAPTCNEPYTVMLQTTSSGVTRETFLLLEDEEQYCQAWDDVHSIMFPSPPCEPPDIDWTNQMGVLLATGSQSNGCHSMRVDCAGTNEALTKTGILVTKVEPGPGCFCTDVIVNPTMIIVMARPPGELMLRARTETLTCGL